VRRKDIFKPTTGNESLYENSNDNGIGKITVNHNYSCINCIFVHVQLIYRAISRQKGTTEKLPCKIPYLFYNVFHVESSTYISQKIYYGPKF
jgi:hypothetical protein